MHTYKVGKIKRYSVNKLRSKNKELNYFIFDHAGKNY